MIELYSSAQMEANSPASLYMKELQSFLSRVASDYLSLYHCPDLMKQE